MTTIRSLVERGVISGNETPYVHPQNGQTYWMYRFPKRGASLMAMSTRPAVDTSVLVTSALPIRFAVPRPATRAATPAAATGLGLRCHGGKQNGQKAPTKLPALHCLVPSLPV